MSEEEMLLLFGSFIIGIFLPISFKIFKVVYDKIKYQPVITTPKKEVKMFDYYKNPDNLKKLLKD